MLRPVRWLALVIAIGATTAAASGAADASTRTCGRITAGGTRLTVMIERGSARCPEARKVLRTFLNGGGVEHGSGPAYQKWWAVEGWRCASGAGGGVCNRGTARIEAID